MWIKASERLADGGSSRDETIVWVDPAPRRRGRSLVAKGEVSGAVSSRVEVTIVWAQTGGCGDTHPGLRRRRRSSVARGGGSGVERAMRGRKGVQDKGDSQQFSQPTDGMQVSNQPTPFPRVVKSIQSHAVAELRPVDDSLQSQLQTEDHAGRFTTH